MFSNDDPPVTGWVCSEGMLCNPWNNDCPSDEKCRPYDRGTDEWRHSSACDWVVEPAEVGDPCTYPNDCATGLACVAGACVQVCELDAPACPAEAPSCTPALTEAVTGVEHVGLCS